MQRVKSMENSADWLQLGSVLYGTRRASSYYLDWFCGVT